MLPLARERDFSQALVQKTLGTNINGGAIIENMIYDPQTDQTVNARSRARPSRTTSSPPAASTRLR